MRFAEKFFNALYAVNDSLAFDGYSAEKFPNDLNGTSTVSGILVTVLYETYQLIH